MVHLKIYEPHSKIFHLFGLLVKFNTYCVKFIELCSPPEYSFLFAEISHKESQQQKASKPGIIATYLDFISNVPHYGHQVNIFGFLLAMSMKTAFSSL